MIKVKKAFTLKKSELGKKFRVENNNLDITALLAGSELQACRLGDLAVAHREERNKKETANVDFRFVQIGDIDVQLGRIKSFRVFKGSDAPNNARRKMKTGDVLISTRRPTRGAVVAVPKEFDGHICSVFFTCLRVNDWDVLDPWYLSLFLRTSLGRFQFQSMVTETAYPVISDDDVENMTILLPKIEVQRDLAKNYGEAVVSFFEAMNRAYQDVTTARQMIETSILGVEAEVLTPPIFGLAVEEELEAAEEAEGSEAIA
jgi:hypothetical protein